MPARETTDGIDGDAGGEIGGPDADSDADGDDGDAHADDAGDDGWEPEAGPELPAPRWLFALPKGSGQVFLGWRFDPDGRGVIYDVFRRTEPGPEILLATVTDSTNLLDRSVEDGLTYSYFVRAIAGDGTMSPVSNEATVTASAVDDRHYLHLDDGLDGFDRGSFRVGDVDEDGLLEWVLKVQAGPGSCPDGAARFLVFDHDGTPLVDVDTGIFRAADYPCDMRCLDECAGSRCCADPPDCTRCSHSERCCRGAQGSPAQWFTYVPWTVWDIDLDGRAELITFLRAGERDMLTIIDGGSGEVEHSLDIGSYFRKTLAVALLDGRLPSLLVGGEYPPNTVTAHDRSLTVQWTANPTNDACHYLRIVQADTDPAQEVLNGAQLLDDDGTELWAAGLGHLDS